MGQGLTVPATCCTEEMHTGEEQHLDTSGPHVGIGGVAIAVEARLVRHNKLHTESLLQNGSVEHFTLQTCAPALLCGRVQNCWLVWPQLLCGSNRR